MHRWISSSAVLAVVLANFGCGDRNPEPSSPTAPRIAAKTVASSCNFNSLSFLANKYFPSSSERNVVKAIIGAMETAGAFTTETQDSGFSVLAHVAANVDAGNPDSTDASTLANGLLSCMYSDPAALPATFPENFLTATDPNSSGAFQVRGKAADNLTAPVYNRPYVAPFSVIAPPTGSDWPGVLGTNPAPRRILVYGRAGSNPYTYDWKVIPRNTTFDPQIVVGVCVDAGIAATSMLNEEHVGLLSFVLVSEAILPATCSPQVVLRQPSAALRFARRVTHGLFDVPAAWAYAGGVGGSTGGIQSEFSALALFGVNVTFTVQPPKNVTVCATPPCGSGFSTTVNASSTTPSGTFTVGGTTLHLVVLNNNGTPTDLYQCTGTSCTNDPVATTDNAGNATFSGLFITNTGAARLVVTNGAVNGRGAIAVGSATSRKLNVNPF
jgi:hypothetical protein